jgi:hypothetical protein
MREVPREIIRLLRKGRKPNTRELLKISMILAKVKLRGINEGGNARASVAVLKVVVKIQYNGRIVITV